VQDLEDDVREAAGADVCFETSTVVKRSFSKAVKSKEELSDTERQEEQELVSSALI
jgi:hypothetical protein